MRNIALLTENSREYGRELLKGVAAFAQERRDWLLRLLTPGDLRERRPLKNFDGAIVRIVDPVTRRRLKEARIPIVDAFCQRNDPDFIGVDSDHAAIARMAADFFLSRRFAHFAFCGFAGTAFSNLRRDAFVRRLADAGFGCAVFSAPEPPDDSIFFEEKTDLPRTSAALTEWLKALPSRTAIFCSNDLRAYQLLRIAADCGRAVPQDLAILGVDDDTLLCSFATPPLSSINPNARRVGYAAARLLHAALENPAPRKMRPIYHVAPGDLIERASTEFHPVDPAWLSDALVYIDRNLTRPVSTADLVAHTGVSHTSIEKVFHRFFGMSAGQYILSVKMDAAQRLIGEGQLSGKEIAARTGFSSPQYFCRTYRNFFGHAPFSPPANQSRG